MSSDGVILFEKEKKTAYYTFTTIKKPTFFLVNFVNLQWFAIYKQEFRFTRA